MLSLESSNDIYVYSDIICNNNDISLTISSLDCSSPPAILSSVGKDRLLFSS